jgi:hypothetical protein
MRRTPVLFALLAATGCSRQPETTPPVTKVTADGIPEVQALPGHAVKVTRVVEEQNDGPEGTSETISSSKGPRVATSSDEVAQKMQFQAVQAAEKGGQGGGFSYSGKLSGRSWNLFYVLGAGTLLVAGGLFIVTKDVKRSLLAAALGGLFIGVGVTIEQFPEIWLVAIGGLLILGGVWIYDAWKHRRLGTALTTVVAGISDLTPELRGDVKDSIGEQIKTDKQKAVVESEIAKAKIKGNI